METEHGESKRAEVTALLAEFENLWEIDAETVLYTENPPPCYTQLLANRDQTVCFTGHRSIPRESTDAVKSALIDAVRAHVLAGYTLFLTGGAIGFDMLSHEAVTAVRAEYPFVRAIVVIPCLNQTERWSKKDRERYCAMIESADGCLCLQKEYTADCMHKRNRFMVDHSACCIAYYSGQARSGTGSTVAYASRMGLPVYNIHPALREQVPLLI